MAQSMTGHVFISYSRKDEAVMRRIATFLRKEGIRVWVDNEKLIPGNPNWEAEVEKAIISAGAVVVLLSLDSKISPWVRREISFAEEYDKRIFPVLISGNEKDIPIRLTTHQRVDLRQNEEVGLSSLAEALLSYLEDFKTQEKDVREAAINVARTKSQVAKPKESQHPATNALNANTKKWKLVIPIVVALILLGAISGPLFNRMFSAVTSVSTATSTATMSPTVSPTITFTLMPACRPLGNQPPTIYLNAVPKSVQVNQTAELTITVSDPENDSYEILAIIVEKGRIPNGTQKPYLYVAPGTPGEDVVTVTVRDYSCISKEEIRIPVQ